MKKLLCIFMAVLLLCTGCVGKESAIKKVTAQFESACNKLDLNEMLDCINPDISEKVKLATGLVGMFADKDREELLDGLAALLIGEGQTNTSEFFESVKIKLLETDVQETTATANAEITYTISGEEYTNKAMFDYIYTDDKWYISSLDIE